jgi:tetratricopeptide (TPR) repeat protein
MFVRMRQHAEALSAGGRPAEALLVFQAARRVAPTSDDEARLWFRIGVEYARLGKLALALDAYSRYLASAEADTTALGNSAELLMALGRLDEAIALYREALAIEERAVDRRAHLVGLASGYLGLGVALDRSGRDAASREAIGRALALDPGLGVLRLAEQGSGEQFLVPPEDASYYLALARVAQGRTADALTAFQSYLEATAKRRAGDSVPLQYLERARGHVAALTKRAAPPLADAAPVTRGWRLVREATLSTDGPLVAPLIDAAWRLAPRLIDDCLSELPPTVESSAGELRLRLEVMFDGTGRVQSATVAAAVALPATFTSCIQTALVARLRPPRPAHKKVTRARIELVLAPAEPSGV